MVQEALFQVVRCRFRQSFDSGFAAMIMGHVQVNLHPRILWISLETSSEPPGFFVVFWAFLWFA